MSSNYNELIEVANEAHELWENRWNPIKTAIQSRGEKILCDEECNDCCFTRKFCTLSEGARISDYMYSHFSPEEFENFRLRVEHATSCLAKLRSDDACVNESVFYRNGGLECPFLKNGRCAIYRVRPIDCRTQIVTDKTNRDDCRKCPRIACCIETEAEHVQLRKHLIQKEIDLGFQLPFEYPMIPEILSYLWGRGMPTKTHQVTNKSMKLRLDSRNTDFDQTWQDDKHDFGAISRIPLSLPDEGQYGDDLLVLKINPELQEVYGEKYKTKGIYDLRVLYKLNPEGWFDWKVRKFATKNENEEPCVVWMGDSIQERLMMWEAAKRSRGKVLCGGLGMGIFPQYALSLPRVESVHVVEMSPTIISIIKDTWNNKPWARSSSCDIHQSKIEGFLKSTPERFDTIYIDTWDALVEEYLPHINIIRELSSRVLNPGGEIILWGYDFMLRLCLNQARNILSRREYFLGADKRQLKIVKDQTPLFYNLLKWFKKHPGCSDDDLYEKAYRTATEYCKEMGVLSLDHHPGL